MYHGFGMFVNLFTLDLNMTEVFLKRFDEELYLSLIEKYKVLVNRFKVCYTILMSAKITTISYNTSNKKSHVHT